MAGVSMSISFGLLFSLASSARIGQKPNADARSGFASRIGPDGEEWVKGKHFVCMQKYEQSAGKLLDSYCLANLETVLASKQGEDRVRFSRELATCESSKDEFKLKLCALKGEAAEIRLSYSTKKHVSKACFRESTIEAKYPIIEAATDAQGCEAAMRKPTEAQFILPRLTTTTTTPEATTTIEELETREDHDEIIEAKALFVAGDQFLWEYKGKAFKCCVSSAGPSAGKPIKIQDMNAELPAERTFGRATGCGYMFGNTYHNGVKGDLGCPMPSSMLREITGEEFDEIKSSLQASD